jgi:hypothetical protein
MLIPIDGVARNWWLSMPTVGASAAMIFSATCTASSGDETSCRTTTNSSPPRRETVSTARTTPGQAPANMLQQLVADRMAQGVVDRLEAIEVEEHHRHPMLAALGLSQRLLQAVVQQGAIGQAGQAVMVRDMPDALLGLHPLEHFLLQLRIGAGQLGGALDHALLQFLVGAQQGLLGLVAFGDILENPGQVDALGFAGDAAPGGAHPEGMAVPVPHPHLADIGAAGHYHRQQRSAPWRW